MFDSSIYSLSPPTFTRCQNISRMSVSRNDEQSVPWLNLVKGWCKVKNSSPTCAETGFSSLRVLPVGVVSHVWPKWQLSVMQMNFLSMSKFRSQMRTFDQMRTDLQITHHWPQKNNFIWAQLFSHTASLLLRIALLQIVLLTGSWRLWNLTYVHNNMYLCTPPLIRSERANSKFDFPVVSSWLVLARGTKE